MENSERDGNTRSSYLSPGASLVAQMVKHPPAAWETWVRSLGWEDSLEKEMTTHSSTLAWKIPRTEELGAGQCPWGRKELGTTERLHFHGGPQSGSDLTLMLRGQLFTWGAWVLGMGRATVGAVCSQ